MKKIMMTLVFLMVCAAPIFANPTVLIEVVLGKKSKGCLFNGICHINVTVSNLKEGITGLASIDDVGNLNIDMLSKDDSVLNDERLTGDFFIIEEDVELPINLMIGLGLKDAHGIIKPGKYQIEHQGDRLSINFGNILN